MTTALDHLGTLRGALSDWLYDPRYTTAPHEAQAAHADAIEAALSACKAEGLGDVAHDLSRGHGWEDTAACWVWRLPRWSDKESSIDDEFEIEKFMGSEFERKLRCRWVCNGVRVDWWSRAYPDSVVDRWTVGALGAGYGRDLKTPEGLALLDTVRPKEVQP